MRTNSLPPGCCSAPGCGPCPAARGAGELPPRPPSPSLLLAAPVPDGRAGAAPAAAPASGVEELPLPELLPPPAWPPWARTPALLGGRLGAVELAAGEPEGTAGELTGNLGAAGAGLLPPAEWRERGPAAPAALLCCGPRGCCCSGCCARCGAKGAASACSPSSSQAASRASEPPPPAAAASPLPCHCRCCPGLGGPDRSRANRRRTLALPRDLAEGSTRGKLPARVSGAAPPGCLLRRAAGRRRAGQPSRMQSSRLEERRPA